MSDTDTLRLAKYIATQHNCSRREADNYIVGGWVSVDGQVIEEPGFRVSSNQKIILAADASPDDVAPVTFLLHKPVGWGASEGHGSAAELLVAENQIESPTLSLSILKRHLAGLILTTSLETDACGLIVASQEHRIHRKLLDDAAHVEMEYVVHVGGTLSDSDLKKLNRPWPWQGRELPAAKVSWQSDAHLRFALRTPPMGLIAAMCTQLGLTVINIKRIRIGRLAMGGLPAGKWRYLSSHERF
ncbi:MAG: RNA-binding protein [Burkholderiaceae bacterium]|nr:RNA-binding protein [Burkholderiaceae bacterium]